MINPLRPWFLVVLVLCFSPVFSQQKKIDSLKSSLRQLPDDTTKVKVYYQLGYAYLFSLRIDSIAVKYADSVEGLSEKINYRGGETLANYLFGLASIERGNYETALEQLQLVVDDYVKKGDSLAVARVLYSIGVAHSNLSDYERNLAIQLRILKIFENKKDSLNLANSYGSIGNVYRKVGKLQEAKEMHREAGKIFKQLRLPKRYAMSVVNLANVYVSMKSYDSARQLFDVSLETIRKLGLRNEEALILGNIGYLYAEENNFKTALKFQQQALTIWQELDKKNETADVLDNIGYLYLQNKNYRKAEEYFQRALAVAKELKTKSLLAELYRELSEVRAGMDDFESALNYNRLYIQMKDSIFNESNALQINELQKKYESEKKDKRITLLAKEKEIQEKEADRQSVLKMASLAGLVLVTTLALIVGYSYNQKLKSQKLLAAKDSEITEANFKRQLSELEMKALRAQINPHFLFNCMNSINRMILEGDNDNASQYLAKFSKLMRLILENAESSKVSLQNELSLLESYIQLEGLRFKGRINYKITVDSSVDPGATYLPSMVLQPFVENAIWHGLLHKRENERGVVEISVSERNGSLYCAIEDNGVGRERARELAEKSLLKKKSMGLKITEDRLRLLSKQSWEKLVNIIDLKDSFNNAMGTRVEINFPIS
jgi:tetratricopeptide (TPR) repeat protein